MAKQIKELKVNFISLVDSPANRRPVVYKSEDGNSARLEIDFRIVQKDDREGILYGVVYEPDTVDTQGDWADAATIRAAAHDFLAKGKVNMVDEQHNYEPGAGTVVESCILAGKSDNYPDVKPGSWVVAIKVADAMKEKMAGIGGISLAGIAVYAEKADTQTLEPAATHICISRAVIHPPARIHRL